MSLTVLHHSQHEIQVEGNAQSIAASPTVIVMHVPMRGRITKVGISTSGTITTTATIAVAVNGTAVTGANFTMSGAAATFSGTPSGGGASSGTAANGWVQEDDIITFTSTGGGGANIVGLGFAYIRKIGG